MSVFPKTVETEDPRVEMSYREQLSRVGNYLQEIRIKQGLSLKQVAQRTHIQLKQLQAIETGNCMQLPEAIYVKGFLKQYAQSLGLDGIKVAETLCVSPPTLNPRWLNQSNFSTREQSSTLSLANWWTRLTPLV